LTSPKEEEDNQQPKSESSLKPAVLFPSSLNTTANLLDIASAAAMPLIDSGVSIQDSSASPIQVQELQRIFENKSVPTLVVAHQTNQARNNDLSDNKSNMAVQRIGHPIPTGKQGKP
jgi:hypothetical protein